jgi:hypothetical protein
VLFLELMGDDRDSRYNFFQPQKDPKDYDKPKIPMELLRILPVSLHFVVTCRVVPRVLWKLESLFLARELLLKITNQESPQLLCYIEEAITSSSIHTSFFSANSMFRLRRSRRL